MSGKMRIVGLVSTALIIAISLQEESYVTTFSY